jgi:Cu/Zn superoxide dismutase
MSLRRIGLGGVLAATTVATIVAVTVPSAGADGTTTIGEGPDRVYGTNALSGASAKVSAADLGSDTTRLVLEVEGVDAPAGTEFGAHVHVNPCGPSPADAGGHYGDGDAGGTLRHREVWLDFSVDAHRRGRAVATRDWAVADRVDRSIVLHVLGTDHATGAAGARLACIDLDA